MAEPYSLDLRERVVAACEEGGETRSEVAERFGVSTGFVYAMLRLSRAEGGKGSLEPKPHTGGFASRVDEAAEGKIRDLVAATPDATLAELCAALAARGGPAVKKSRMGQALAALGLPRKKDAGRV
jgi:transposase